MATGVRAVELTPHERFTIHLALGREIGRVMEPMRALVGTPEELKSHQELPVEIREQVDFLDELRDKLCPSGALKP